jgi:hypothetical protein
MFKNLLSIFQRAQVALSRLPWNHRRNRLALGGKVKMQHVRNGEVLQEIAYNNGITDEGMNALLDIMFGADAQLTTWYISLINNSGFTALANADTMASHTGWTEFVDYDEATRGEWTEGAAAARAITNASAVVFTINGAGTLKGIFITSNSTKSGTTGTLWATAAFASNLTVAVSDEIRIIYTVSG